MLNIPTKDEINSGAARTVAEFKDEWDANIEKNFNDGLQFPELEGQWSGFECILVGFSPSLEKQADSLRRADRNRFKIIACDIALKWLMKEGIKPDAVVSIDSRMTAGRFYLEDGKPIEGLEDMLLVASIKHDPEVLTKWPGPKTMYLTPDAGGYWKKAREKTNTNNILVQGGNVGTAAYCFAYDIMEVKRLILVGNEYGSYDYGRTYCGQAYTKREPSKSKLKWLRKNLKKKLAKLGDEECAVKTQRGYIYTTRNYLQYASWLEMVVEREKSNLFDCSGGGVLCGPGSCIERAELDDLLFKPFEVTVKDFDYWIELALKKNPPDKISLLRVECAPGKFRVYDYEFQHEPGKIDHNGTQIKGAIWNDRVAEKRRAVEIEEQFNNPKDATLIKINQREQYRIKYQGEKFIITAAVARFWNFNRIRYWIEETYAQRTLSTVH